MAGRRVYNSGGCSNTNTNINNNTNNNNSNISEALLQSSSFPYGVVPDQPLDSFFGGSRSMMSFEDVHGGSKTNEAFFRSFDQDEAGDDEFHEYFHQPEKKRRLSAEQVHFLEKSFEFENKLEPERKIQLAKDIGLQPRQVAIWFQNRRARWKSKQLEKEFDALQASYDSLKTDYGILLDEKDKLKAEVLDLTEKLRLREKGDPELSDTDILSKEPPQMLIADPAEGEVSKNSTVVYKQVEISQAKSEIFDSESPHFTDRVHSSLLDPGDSSYPFEPDQSDLSQDEDYTPNKSLLPAYIFPKIEDTDFSDPPTNSCNFGFPVEDQSFWSWSY